MGAFDDLIVSAKPTNQNKKPGQKAGAEVSTGAFDDLIGDAKPKIGQIILQDSPKELDVPLNEWFPKSEISNEGSIKPLAPKELGLSDFVPEIIKDPTSILSNPVGVAGLFPKKITEMVGNVPTALFEELSKLRSSFKPKPGTPEYYESMAYMDKQDEGSPSLEGFYNNLVSDEGPSAYKALSKIAGVEPDQDPGIIKEAISSFANPFEFLAGAGISKFSSKLSKLPEKEIAKIIDDIPVEEAVKAAIKDEVKGVHQFKPAPLNPVNIDQASSKKAGDLSSFFSQAKDESFKILSRPTVNNAPYTPSNINLNSALDQNIEAPKTPLIPKNAEELMGMLSNMPKKQAYEHIDSLQSDDFSKQLLKDSWFKSQDSSKLKPLAQTISENTSTPVKMSVERVPYPEQYSAKYNPTDPLIETLDSVKKLKTDTVNDLKSGKTTTRTMTGEQAKQMVTGGKIKVSEQIPSIDPNVNLKKGSILRSIRHRLLNLGKEVQPLTKELVDRIDRFELLSQRGAGEAISKLKQAFAMLSDSELKNLTEVLDNNAYPESENVKKSAAIIRAEMDKFADEISKYMPDFKRRKNYFPHTFPEELIEKFRKDDNFLREQATNLFKKGKFDTVEEAIDFLRDNFRKKMRSRKLGALDYGRTDGIEGWIRDPKEVLPKYFEDAYRRLAEVKTFGLEVEGTSTPEIWGKLVSDIKQIGGVSDNSEVAKLLEKARQAVLQDYSDVNTSQKVIENVMGLEAVSKLGFAQVTNLGQTVNTAARTSFLDAISGVYKTLTNKQRISDLTDDAGHFMNNISNELANGFSGQTLGSKLATKFLGATGMQKIERYNRMFAAAASETFMNRQFSNLIKDPNNKLARRKLEDLGVDVGEALKRGFLKQDEILDGAFKIIKDTQFTNNPIDLPADYNDPFFKLAFQFKSFAYKQTAFLKKHVVDEAGKGNLQPLVNLALATATIGEITSDLKAVSKDAVTGVVTGDFSFKRTNDHLAMDFIDRQYGNFMQVGGMGLAFDIFSSAEYGEAALAKNLGGPYASDVYTLGSDIFDVYNKRDKKSLQSLFSDTVGLTPIIGSDLRKMTKPEGKRGRKSKWNRN